MKNEDLHERERLLRRLREMAPNGLSGQQMTKEERRATEALVDEGKLWVAFSEGDEPHAVFFWKPPASEEVPENGGKDAYESKKRAYDPFEILYYAFTALNVVLFLCYVTGV